ncbi:MAG: tRNA (cytidine(34)-2'-O)-methyltransferase [Firmicutes bacterium]|nr:tRNA (cytidine(34)-2'-O)-methyltransferase [Bacillota bacterium]
MNIVLLEPEIPSNTGNIARTCVCTGSRLHLIRPLGFSLSEKNLMRAGMDYWHLLDLTVYDDLADFLSQKGQGRLFLATTKGKQTYTDVIYGYDDYIMFGKESAGIPEEFLKYRKNDCIRIPMGPDLRSLNLANSVAVILYEALRQQDFPGMDKQGELHHETYID